MSNYDWGVHYHSGLVTMCKNRIWLIAHKWLLFSKFCSMEVILHNKKHFFRKYFSKMFIFSRDILFFLFFEVWWRHILVHSKKKHDHKKYKLNKLKFYKNVKNRLTTDQVRDPHPQCSHKGFKIMWCITWKSSILCYLLYLRFIL